MSRATRALHPGVDPGCTVCHGTGAVVERDGEYAVAKPCACVKRCPVCKGLGFVTPTGAVASRGVRRQKCECQRLEHRIRRFDEARIPSRHATSTLLTFQKPTKHLMQAVGRVDRWVKDFRRGEENKGLVLFGDVGRGKTHLLCALVREVILVHGASVRFVEFSHLLADLKSGFDRGEGMGALIDDLVRVDVLAIDELGKGRNTEFEGTVLDELVSRRYNALRTIVATTNFPPASTGQSRGDLALAQLPGLPDRVGTRVFSRLREVCEFHPVVGDDWRLHGQH